MIATNYIDNLEKDEQFLPVPARSVSENVTPIFRKKSEMRNTCSCEKEDASRMVTGQKK